MKTLKQVKFILMLMAGIALSSTLVSCFESSSEQGAPPPVTGPGGGGAIPGNAVAGKVFFQQNCSLCHSAGADDTTTAFGGIDLANQNSIISNDISQYSPTYDMMGRFDNIDQERVDDLKKYLAGL